MRQPYNIQECQIHNIKMGEGGMETQIFLLNEVLATVQSESETHD